MSSVGNRVAVHAYKHDGTLYRSWERPYVVYEDDAVLVLYNKFVRVYDAKQRPRFSREDTFWIFYKGRWLNVQVTVREKGALSFYVNVAGPHLVEEGAVKYIDYDLDFKVNVTGAWKEVDMNEFANNSRRYGYEPHVIASVKDVESALKSAFKGRAPIVERTSFVQWFERFVKPARHRFINHDRGVNVDCRLLERAINRSFGVAR